mmetsp:Transcript_124192/g.277093  ORF Transcript_124192/g.277093 Transcript_124192/m.277093 type:complete len:209 (-) Transcript_124192:617-1243(-)
MAAIGTNGLAAMRRLDVKVLKHHGEGDVALGKPLQALLYNLGVGNDAPQLGSGELVVVDDMLVHPLEARGLVESRTALSRVLPTMEDRLPLLLLENALVACVGELGPEPVVIGVLLDLLQRDDVCSHGLELLEDEVFTPSPRKGPLLAIGIDSLCCIQVRQYVPIHHLELLAQPLGVEGSTIADHTARPGLLGGGDDCACGDGHPAHI